MRALSPALRNSVLAAVQKYDLHVHHAFASTLNTIWREGGKTSSLGLAISGGVDSMALASLCREVTNPKSEVMAPLFNISKSLSTPVSFVGFIVNHGLREGSGEEALRVGSQLEKLGIDHQILNLDWRPHGEPTTLSNVESIARRLRYQALGWACSDRGINSLLLAHHRDDQAETVMARLVSNYGGTGLKGMRAKAAIPECAGLYGVDHSGDPQYVSRGNGRDSERLTNRMMVESGGVSILRPLLRIDKEKLVQVCLQRGVQWYEDHTNADPTLTLRNTIRPLLQDDSLPQALRKPKLLALAKRTAEVSNDLEREIRGTLDTMSLTLDVNIGRVTAIFTEPSVDKLRARPNLSAALLRKIIELAAPKHTISLQDLRAAVDLVFSDNWNKRIHEPAFREMRKVQVAGVTIQRVAIKNRKSKTSKLVFYRSIPIQREKATLELVISQPSLDLMEPAEIHQPAWSSWTLWDNRYWIRARRRHFNRQVRIRFLSKDSLGALRKSMTKDDAKQLDEVLASAKGSLRFTLPAIVEKRTDKQVGAATKERIVALPSVGWSGEGWRRDGDASGPLNIVGLWDIRYKHVDLGTKSRMHMIVS